MPQASTRRHRAKEIAVPFRTIHRFVPGSRDEGVGPSDTSNRSGANRRSFPSRVVETVQPADAKNYGNKI